MHRSPKEAIFLFFATLGIGILGISYLYSTSMACYWMDKWHGQLAGDLTLLTAGIPAYYVFARMIFWGPMDPMFVAGFITFHAMLIIPPAISLAVSRKPKRATS